MQSPDGHPTDAPFLPGNNNSMCTPCLKTHPGNAARAAAPLLGVRGGLQRPPQQKISNIEHIYEYTIISLSKETTNYKQDKVLSALREAPGEPEADGL